MLAASLMHLGFVADRDFVVRDDGSGAYIHTWMSQEAQPTVGQIASASLSVTKLERIEQINAECRARLIARYGPAEEQVSRSIGVYGAQAQSDMQAGIAATIDASNVAQNAILAAADLAAVEAVTVTWPVI